MPYRLLLAAMAGLLCLAATTADARPVPRDARAFAQRLVDRLNQAPVNDLGVGVPHTTEWYDAGWLRLEDETDRLATARDVTSPLEATDPLCDCEHHGFRYAVGAMSLRRDGVVVLQLRSFNGSDWTSHPVWLRRVAAQWRVWSVITEGSDWRSFLTQYVACMHAARTHAAAERCDT